MFLGGSNLGEKKRWSSVRSYLCGDEFNSVLAVDDSGSIKDSLDPLLTMSKQLSSDSVLAIQDSASVKLHQEQEEEEGSVSGKNSEVSVTQPLHKEEQSEATETHIPKRHQTTLISKLFLEEDAAVKIQSAFRTYLVCLFFSSSLSSSSSVMCTPMILRMRFRQNVGATKWKKRLIRRRARNHKVKYPWGHH